MCKHPALIQVMFGWDQPPPEAIERYAVAAVRTFLAANGPTSG
jgi:hypothetical protein